jgi:hypothetical protein
VQLIAASNAQESGASTGTVLADDPSEQEDDESASKNRADGLLRRPRTGRQWICGVASNVVRTVVCRSVMKQLTIGPLKP